MMSRAAQEMAYDDGKILLGKAFREVIWQSSKD